MVTGRPLYVNPALNAADAFVVAWLPGSEGAGVADVLVGDASGQPRHDFAGKLPADWPRAAQMEEGILFPFGYGLDYTTPASGWTALPELDAGAVGGDSRMWLAAGSPAARWSLWVAGGGPELETRITTLPAAAFGGRVRVTAENHKVQEGARRFAVTGGTASVQLGNLDPVDIARETNGDVMLLVTLRVWDAPTAARIGAIGPGSEGFVAVTLPAREGYVRYGVPLKCLRGAGADVAKLTRPFVLETEGRADFAIAEVRLGSDAEQVLPCR